MTLPRVLTTPEVGALLHCSSRTVHRLVKDEKLPAIKQMTGPYGAFLFDPADVQKYIDAKAEAAAA